MKNFNFFKINLRAFSLVEMLITLIVISCIMAIMVPVISKKLSSNAVTINSGSISEITTNCTKNGFSETCELCTKSICLSCKLESCSNNQFVETKACKCENCTEKYGNLCQSCDESGCTRCISSDYYVKDRQCLDCPPGKYCDGKDIYASCPTTGGYYCDSSGIHKCNEKYSLKCTQCNATQCTKCSQTYYVNGTDCEPCYQGVNGMGACATCENPSKCTVCSTDYYLENNVCAGTCKSVITGCLYCSNKTTCTRCSGSYYLNTANKCTQCTLENCLKCKGGQSESSPVCETCAPGYYYNKTTKKCESCSKYHSDCVACNDTECTSCAPNYHLSDDRKSCESTDDRFNCSDSNFMRIGKLCMTRRNMGDLNSYLIPSSVITVNGADICYSQNNKCCWNKSTAINCNGADDYGGYSGCTRTVCNWNAADEICKNFKYDGKTWRLPTKAELDNIAYLYSYGLNEKGLMLCDRSSGYGYAQCSYTSSSHKRCLGSYEKQCRGYAIWSSNVTNDKQKAYMHMLQSGAWNPATYMLSDTASVRCVTEME